MLALALIVEPAYAQYYEQIFANASMPQTREVRRPQPAHAILWDLGPCSGALNPDLRIEGSYDRQVWTEIGARLVMVRPDANGRCTAIQTAPYFTPYVRARIVSTPQPLSAWYASSEVAPPTIMVNVPGQGAYVFAYNATRGGTYSYTVGDTRVIEVRGPAGATVIERGTWGNNPYEQTLGTIPSTGWYRVGQVVTATGKVITTIIFSLPGDTEAPGPPPPPAEVKP